MRRELRFYATWYNQWRTHMALAGKTPRDVYDGRSVVRRRIETRPQWPHRPRRSTGDVTKIQLAVSYVEGRKHLPVIELRRAA
jgi:hypothetical protein